MAQSALTVTPPNPTPPTNMSCTGSTPPNLGTFVATVYDRLTRKPQGVERQIR
jgi:hypothetical protein